MKKLLCYLGIVFLLFLISLPPLLRYLMPPKEQIETSKVIESRILNCSDSTFVVNSIYFGDDIQRIIMKKINSVSSSEDDTDSSDFSQSRQELNDLFTKLSTDNGDYTINELDDGIAISIDFVVSTHENLLLNNIKQDLDIQKVFYENANLTCEVRSLND